MPHAPLLAIALSLVSFHAPGAEFDARFTGQTLRFDYLHVGGQGREEIALGGLRLEGEWPGSRTRLVDSTNLGKYLFQVVDPATQAVVYSRGFASIYGEWETTGEAKSATRAIAECQRFPEPRGPVQLALKKRADDGTFREIFAALVDPAARSVDRSPLAGPGDVVVLFESGAPRAKVDLLVVAEGYAASERAKFEADALRLTAVLFDTEPFRARKADFNARALFVPAPDSGLSDPRAGVWKSTVFGSSFNAFDSDRYVLTFRDRDLREAAARAPYDALILLCNVRKYGGGGIFNLWSTCAAGSAEAPYLFVHEFGHAFAGLADEYYSSQVAYEDFTPAGSEPWEPNVTALLDPTKLKWRDLVEAATPLPTPWRKEAFDAKDLEYQARRAELAARKASNDEVEALMAEVKRTSGPMLREDPWAGKVGAFEGAMYEARGLYRPEADCIMFTRNPSSFCRVCARAIERVIDAHVR